MTTYIFVVEGTISLSTEVEADSLAEAIEEAMSRSTMAIPVNVGDQTIQWVTEIDCDASAGTVVDFHGGAGETFEQVEAAWNGNDE